ncbi:hypothetical protein ACGF1Z_11860 [Streptomyces sp. NPDC048018]|uniref:hypothetical protein n=1 Tax=Streptomyces sp. NPDC048018 TaxID=3365499 RepID=UPI00371D33A3
MTVDDNEVRAGNAAGQAVSAISLPAVAWQQAGDEPARKPEGGPQGEPDGSPGGKAGQGTRGESGSGPVEGAVAPGPAPVTAAEPESPAAPSAVASGAAPAVPAPGGGTGTGTDSAAEAGARAGAGTGDDSGGEDAPVGAPASGAHGAQAASDADGLATEAASAAPAARSWSRPGRRLPKPVIAAAATSGVVLMGVPLLLSQLGGGGSGPGSVPPPRPTGYNQADGGPGGFVPRADAPEKGSPLPGTARPGAPAGTGKGSSAAGKGPLSTGLAGAGAGIGAGVGVGAPAGPAPASPAHATAPSAPRETAGPPRKPATQVPPAPPAKQQYTAVAGPNCAGAGATFTSSGWYTDDKEGWQKYGSGGYASGGCNGGFFSLPMSGKTGSDAGSALRWTFRTGAVTSGTCQVSVHIPSHTDIKAVGGKPSYYTVHAGTTGNDPILRSFTLDQQSVRGQWVNAGSVRITGGVLTVKLHDRGLDWSGSQKTYAHHAGDAARVQCTSA